MKVWFEEMSGVFHKTHIPELGIIIHRFWGPDNGDPHDHNFDIEITVIENGYIERVWQLDGSHTDHHRKPGDSFVTAHDKIHRIIELPNGPAQTITRYGPKVQEPGFYRFVDGVAYRRQWNEQEWVKK